MNGGHQSFPRVRKFPEYPASGFIGMALAGLFIFTGVKIGWGLAIGVFVGAWVLFRIIIPVLFNVWRKRNVQG